MRPFISYIYAQSKDGYHTPWEHREAVGAVGGRLCSNKGWGCVNIRPQVTSSPGFRSSKPLQGHRVRQDSYIYHLAHPDSRSPFCNSPRQLQLMPWETFPIKCDKKQILIISSSSKHETLPSILSNSREPSFTLFAEATTIFDSGDLKRSLIWHKFKDWIKIIWVPSQRGIIKI